MDGEGHAVARRQLQVSIGGHILTLLIVLGLFITFIRTNDRSISEATSAASAANRNVGELSDLVKRMDEHGTNYSHTNIPLEQNLITAVQSQVSQNTKTIGEVTPKLERMVTQMEYVQSWVQEQRLEKERKR